MAYKELGVDVSHHNNDKGPINWKAVKNDGVDFALIKATENMSYVDPYFKSNVKNAKANGLKVGAYHFARFRNVSTMKAELDHFLSTIKGVGLTYPAILDIETNDYKLSTKTITDLAIQFLEGIEKAGYFAMIYTGKAFLEEVLDESRLKPYAKWIARYNSTLGRTSDMWQFTDRGTVKGIKGGVDMNWNYRSDLFGVKGADIVDTVSKPVTKPVATPKPKPTPKPSKSIPNTYKVKSGDTLSGIASKYGLSVDKLVKWNNIKNKNVISIGQVLKLKKPTSTSKTITVKSGDTLSELAVKYGTTVAKIKSLNGLKSDLILIGQKLKVK